ncbi:hypothetical protein C8R47DRAFT_1085018 [Mycena vitilis]|nr:hypothetical protein C8R47DRAFT_1085018 [Mycena vitilis]
MTSTWNIRTGIWPVVRRHNEPPNETEARELRFWLAAVKLELNTVVPTGYDHEQTGLTVHDPYDPPHRMKVLAELAQELQGALSRMRVMPPEILAEIFLICRDNVSAGCRLGDMGQAPWVLTQVSSRWRGVCLGDSRLWNQVSISSVHPMPSSAFLHTLLDMANDLPLQVELRISLEHLESHPTWDQDRLTTDLSGPTRRFSNISLAVKAPDVEDELTEPQVVEDEVQDVDDDGEQGSDQEDQPDREQDSDQEDRLWNGIAEEKQLIYFSSFALCSGQKPYVGVTANDIFRELFATARGLQDTYDTAFQLDHDARVPIALWALTSLEGISTSRFPWAFLTEIELRIDVETVVARKMLEQCASIKKCMLRCITTATDQDAVPAPSSVSRLEHLQDMQISFRGADDPAPFLVALELPGLTELRISAVSFPMVLLDLHACAPFNLEELELELLSELNGKELIPFLRLLPSLRLLRLASEGFDDDLIDAFTYEPSTCAAPILALPNLQALHLGDWYCPSGSTGTKGALVTRMACSLSQSGNVAFPSIEEVFLAMPGEKFTENDDATLKGLEIVKYSGFRI